MGMNLIEGDITKNGGKKMSIGLEGKLEPDGKRLEDVRKELFG